MEFSATGSPEAEVPGQLVLWLGDHASAQIPEFAAASLRGVALSLPSVGRNRKALKLADESGLRAALDPEPWRNQLDVGHPKRAGGFSLLPYALQGEGSWDPAAPLSPSEIEDLPHAWLQAQVSAGGLELIIPGHVYDGIGGAARENDLALARRALEIAEAQMLRAGAPDGEGRRIVVQLNLRLAGVEPLELKWLVDAYAELEAESYWINAVAFTGSAKQFALVRAIARGLKARTGAEVTVAGLGRLWPGALIEGLDSVCFGYQRSEFPFPPPNLAEELDEDDGLGVHVYHSAVMGAIRLGEEGEWTRRFLFQRFPCRCGHHPATEPPEGKPAQIRHNAWCAARELAWATSPKLSQAQIDSRIVQTQALRKRLKMARLKTGWTVIAIPDDSRQAESGEGS